MKALPIYFLGSPLPKYTDKVPILKSAELDRPTLVRLYYRLDALIARREQEDTSGLSYLDALSDVQIELLHLLEGHDV